MKDAAFLHSNTSPCIACGEVFYMVMFAIVTALFFAALTLCTLRVRIGSRAYRGMQRCLYAAGMLFVSGLVSSIGVNALNLLCVSLLGAPGLGLLHVLARLP